MSLALRRPAAAAASSLSTGAAVGGSHVLAGSTATLAEELPPRDSQTCTLPDGRVLGFAEYGDPAGQPLLYFHGFPTCRLEAQLTHDLAARLRLRVLALDRPGFGLSTAQPGRTMLDWPADVLAFAQRQQLAPFGILGVSGGGPYALACARALPRARLTSVGLFAAAGHFDSATRAAIPRRSRVVMYLSEHWPWVLRILTAAVVGVLRWAATSRLGAWYIDGLLEQAAQKRGAEPAGQKPIAVQRQEALRALFHAFDGGYQPSVDEAYLLGHDWGFRFEDIAFDPIRVWHGDQYANVPLGWIRPLVARLPHAELKVYEGKSHYTLVDHMEEILATFVPAKQS